MEKIFYWFTVLWLLCLKSVIYRIFLMDRWLYLLLKYIFTLLFNQVKASLRLRSLFQK